MLVTIYAMKISSPLTRIEFDRYLSFLPQSLIDKTLKFQRQEDRNEYLLGKILLIKLLSKYRCDIKCLNVIEYNPFGKPFIPGLNVDFNISHSKGYIACAIGRDCKIGIDIEKIRFMDLENLLPAMSSEQKSVIQKSPTKIHTFLKYWTIKESVLKAEGIGLNYKLEDVYIDTDLNLAFINENKFYYKEIFLNHECVGCISTNKLNTKIEIKALEPKNII